jgi:hypothetical protein
MMHAELRIALTAAAAAEARTSIAMGNADGTRELNQRSSQGGSYPALQSRCKAAGGSMRSRCHPDSITSFSELPQMKKAKGAAGIRAPPSSAIQWRLPATTGDSTRDQTRRMLHEAFDKSTRMWSHTQDLRGNGLVDTAKMAEEAENSMVREFGEWSKAYKTRYRTLKFNIDAHINPGLVYSLITGARSMQDLATMDMRELVNVPEATVKQAFALAEVARSEREALGSRLHDLPEELRKCIICHLGTRALANWADACALAKFAASCKACHGDAHEHLSKAYAVHILAPAVVRRLETSDSSNHTSAVRELGTLPTEALEANAVAVAVALVWLFMPGRASPDVREAACNVVKKLPEKLRKAICKAPQVQAWLSVRFI